MKHHLHRHSTWTSLRLHFLSSSFLPISFLSSTSSYSVARRRASLVHRFEGPTSARPVLPHFMKPFANPAEQQEPLLPQHDRAHVGIHSIAEREGDDAKEKMESFSLVSSSNGKQREPENTGDQVRRKGKQEEAKQHHSEVHTSPWTTVLPPWPVDVLEFNTSMGSDGGHALRHFYGPGTVLQATLIDTPKSPDTPHVRKGKESDGDLLPSSSGSTSVSPQRAVDRSVWDAKEKAKVEATKGVYRAWCDWWSTTHRSDGSHRTLESSMSYPTSNVNGRQSTDDVALRCPDEEKSKTIEEIGDSLHRRRPNLSSDKVQEEMGWLCEQCLHVHVGLSFATALKENVASAPSLFSFDDAHEPDAYPKEVEGQASAAVNLTIPPFPSFCASPTTGSGSLVDALNRTTSERYAMEASLSPASLPTLKGIGWKDIALRTVCPHCHSLRPDRVRRAYEKILIPILTRTRDVLTDHTAIALTSTTAATTSTTTSSHSSFVPSWWMCGRCLEYNIHLRPLSPPTTPAATETMHSDHICSSTASTSVLLPPRDGAPLLSCGTLTQIDVCRCCTADGGSFSGHFLPPFPLSSSPLSLGRESHSRDTECALPFQSDVERTKGGKNQEESPNNANTSFLPKESDFCGTSFPLRPLPPASYLHEPDDLIGKPIHSIVNIRNKLMKWSCGHCREVSSLQSPYCRYCQAERYGFIIACPRCAAFSCLSNAMVYGEGSRGLMAPSLGSFNDDTAAGCPPTGGSDSPFGPHFCFSPLAARIRCERCQNILHGGDVVRWLSSEKKKQEEKESPAGSVFPHRSSSPLSSLSSSFSFVMHHKMGSGGKGWWCGCGFVNPPLVASCLRCRLPRWLPPQQREAVVLRHWDREGCTHWWCEVCHTINRASAKVVVAKKQKKHERKTEETKEQGETANEGWEMYRRTPTTTTTTSPPTISMVKTTRTQHGDLCCTCCGSPWHFDQLQEDIVSTTSSLKKGNRGDDTSNTSSSSFGSAANDVESVGGIGNERQTTETSAKEEDSVVAQHEMRCGSDPGDCPVTCWWRCACHHVNRRYNPICACCDLPPQTKGITADVLSFWTKGDWICAQCLRHNYKLKVVCLCGARRSVASTH